jgi:molecular chaperone DnaJ
MRLNGEGDTGQHGGPVGHLYVYISVQPHADFVREDDDLVYTLAMNPAQAALGFEAEVPTLDGDPATVKVPAGTQSGKVFTLRSKGVPHLHRGGRGDLLVRAEVQTPTELSEEQRELLKKLADTFGTPVGEDKGLLGKIKEKLG